MDSVESCLSSNQEDDSDDNDESEEYSLSEVNIGNMNTEVFNEITTLLNNHNVVDSGNALALNKEMQRRLLNVRDKLQQLMKETKQRYAANEERLQTNMKRGHNGVGMRGAYLRGGTFYFKGNMFFKDRNCRNCPNNSDYETRLAGGEMFPMDFELQGRHVWSLVDKAGIVEAIKEQVLIHVGDQAHNTSEKRRTKKVDVHSEKLVNLLKRADENFEIDWQQVSAYNLHHRHSASSCKAMWNMYLHPSLERSKWTAEENNALLEAAKAKSFQNWDEIAAVVGKRSAYQCFVQYQTEVCYMLPERWAKWTKEDDGRLMELIEHNTINGVIKWNAISQHFPKKPKCSIIQRYTDHLHPRISHANFTPEEDLILLAAVQEYGTKFSCFPRTLFPNRSVTQLRTRYRNTLQNRHKHTAWTLEDDEKLMEFVQTHGTSSWLQCSERLESKHSRISCRTRFLTILKYFKKNPNALLVDLPRKKTHHADTAITTENWIEKVSELRENPGKELKKVKAKVPRERSLCQKKETSKPLKEPNRKTTKKRSVVQTEVDSNNQTKRKATKTVTKQSTQIMKRCRRKAIHVERLRPIELKFYHFFKYAYNFRLGENQCIQVSATSTTICQVSNALGFSLPVDRRYEHGNNLPHSIRPRCKTALKRADNICLLQAGHHLPPNWSSLMAFRALCVQASQVDAGALCATATANIQHEAVIFFRMRLRALLYQTTLLSRLQPNSIEGIQNRRLELLSANPVSPVQSKEVICNVNTEKTLCTDTETGNDVEIAMTQLSELEKKSTKRKRNSQKLSRGNDAKRKCDQLEATEFEIKLEPN